MMVLHFILNTSRNIFFGYMRFFKIISSLFLRMCILCFFSFLIVFPQWYFAIHYKTGYNIFIFIFLSCFIVYITGVKIFRYMKKEVKIGRILPVLFRFLVLMLELYLIRFLLLQTSVFFIIPGILLSCEFLFFLCLIKGKDEILYSWMRTILIIITSFEILYSAFVLFTRGSHQYAVILLLIYIAALGYLLYNVGKSVKNKKQMKSVSS